MLHSPADVLVRPWSTARSNCLAPVILIMGLFAVGAPVAALFASLYLDKVADAIEENSSYASDPRAPGTSLATGLGAGIRLAGLVLVADLLLLPADAFLPGIGQIATIVVNGFLLGREYFELAALRHVSRKAAEALQQPKCCSRSRSRSDYLRPDRGALRRFLRAFVRRGADGAPLQTHRPGGEDMIRRGLALCLFALLGACATRLRLRSRTRCRPLPPTGRACKHDRRSDGSFCYCFFTTFGTPAFLRKDGNIQFWRYKGVACQAFFFLYPDHGNLTVQHVETLPHPNNSAADINCLQSLHAAPQPVS